MKIKEYRQRLLQKCDEYPHIKVTYKIAKGTILSFFLSLVFINCNFLSSIFSNIFAGFLTGLVLSLISSIKSKSLIDIDIAYNYLNEIHDRYLTETEALVDYRKIRNANDDDYQEGVYLLVSEMNAIEEKLRSGDNDPLIEESLGNKPTLLFSSDCDSDYNIENQKRQYDEIIFDYLNQKMSFDHETRFDIDNKIYYLHLAHKMLNSRVYKTMKELRAKQLNTNRIIL